jgi:FMN-dependent oxidoreductase (nitrilotriacetate monooxygenase family)
MSRLQHFGWFFGRGFGPQGWGRADYEWNYDWTSPKLYQQSIRELEQAGLDLLIIEDALSVGSPETLDLRVRAAYGAPKLDPLLLTPYLLDATSHIGIAPTINAGATPPYLAARQAATLQHLSSNRFGINLVTDVKSARHFGLEELSHDAAYARAEEWLDVVRRLWHSWEDGALVENRATGQYADGSKLQAFQHAGEYFKVAGPLNAPPMDSDPIIVSPGGSGPGLAFAGANSDVQLALAPLTVPAIRAYRAKIHEAVIAHGRQPSDIKILFVFKPEIVASQDEVDRVVAASLDPTDAEVRAVLAGQSSDLETDLTILDLDKPLDPSVFGQHVSQGTIKGLLGGSDSFESQTLRDLAVRKARKGRISDGSGFVGTVDQVADFIELLGDEADNDGFIFSGDLHPVTVHGYLDHLVPALRKRGVLRSEFGNGGTRQNLRDF